MFTLTCSKCGSSVNITNDNFGDYYRVFAWKYSFIPKEQIKDKILIYDIEDTTAESIICECGNEVHG